MVTKSEIEETLESNPGDPLFVDHAESLRVSGNLQDALLVALRGVSTNPSLHRGRLTLARIFYELGCYPFAANEIAQLAKALPESAAIQKLHEKLSPYTTALPSAGTGSGEVIGEAEFDVDDIDDLGSQRD